VRAGPLGSASLVASVTCPNCHTVFDRFTETFDPPDVADRRIALAVREVLNPPRGLA